MEGSEKVTGKKIFNILEQLKNNHTTINMHVMGTSFDSLSIVLDVAMGVFPYFNIDLPNGRGASAALIEGSKCYFEFYTEEKIKCKFKATIAAVKEESVKINFPEFIEKTQRRKAFRVEVPQGTKIKCTSKNTQLDMDVLNIGEGGILTALKSSLHNDSLLFMGSILNNLQILSLRDGKSVNISVKCSEIVRVENKKELGFYYYGIRFTEMDLKAEGEIMQFIYYCQRQLLKKRGGFDS